MEKQVTSHAQNDESKKYYRFQVFQGEADGQGKVQKSKSVGMAYLKDGQNIFTLRLWMFSWERYYRLTVSVMISSVMPSFGEAFELQ